MVWMFRNYKGLFLFLWLLSSGTLARGADPPPGIKFIENKNQWPEQVDFSARVPGGRMFIGPQGFNYYFLDEVRLQELHEHSRQKITHDSDGIPINERMIDGTSLAVTFVDANSNLTPQAFGKSSEYYNYFLGGDTCTWASNAHAYNGVIYSSLYEGIDLKVYSSGMNIKYDFIVAPGSDISQILIGYNGADLLRIDPYGDLIVETSLGNIIEKKPVAYQYIGGKKTLVECQYILRGNQLSFSFSYGYDPCYELVIDPLLIFATYSGSTADNWGSTATPGEHGNLYSAGVTNLTPVGAFPATQGAFQTNYGGIYDIGILKYDSAGQNLLYATYLGGSETESAHSLVMNSREELIVLGTTGSFDFPTTLNAFDRTFNGGTRVTGVVVPYQVGTDIFVARISKNGDKLLASTLFGGSENDGLNPLRGALEKNYGDQLRGDVITDLDDNIYISSVSSSSDFPVADGIDTSYNGGATDAVVAKLSKELTQVFWSTYLGGSGADASLTLKFDKDKNLFIAGGTTSVDFPVSAGSYQSQIGGDADGWIANISNDGDTIIKSTFTGTSAFDQIYFLDLNENDEVYVYGQSAGSFPITPGVFNNPNSGQFIQKFDVSLSKLIFSTVFGSGRGTPDISPTAFLVNECNNLYLAGWGGIVNILTDHWQNNTLGMPITADAFQKTSSGSDFYFMVLTDDATELLYGTYLGGRQSRTHVDGGTSRFDKGGVVYHAVCSGCASFNATNRPTSDFPITSGAYSLTNNSRNCNNAAFKFDLSSLKARLQSNSVKLDMPGLNKLCIPDKIIFQNFSIGGEVFEWDLGDGTKITKTDTSMILHEYPGTGTYTVWLKAIDKGTCKGEDSVSLRVDVFIADTQVQDDDAMCFDSPYTLQARGGAKYSWISEDGTFESNIAMPTVNPKDTTRYFITITEASGCIQKDTVDLAVIPVIKPEFDIGRNAECFERPGISVINKTDSLKEGDRLYFDFGDGSTSDEAEAQHEFKDDGLYTVKLVGVREFCVTEKIIAMPVFKLFIPNIITPAQTDNANDKFTIQYGDVAGVTPSAYGFKTHVVIYNRWGEEVYESSDYQYDWDGHGLASGIYYFEVTVDGHTTCKSWIQLVR